MAVTPSPVLTLNIRGEDALPNKNIVENLVVNGKLNFKFDDVVSTDPALVLPLPTSLGTISKIIILGTNAILNVSTSAPSTFSIPVATSLLWGVDSTFAATITGLSIQTSSTTPVDIEVIITGV